MHLSMAKSKWIVNGNLFHVTDTQIGLLLCGWKVFTAINSYNLLMLTNLLLYLTYAISHDLFIHFDKSFISPSAGLKISRDKSVSQEKSLHGYWAPRDISSNKLLFLTFIIYVQVCSLKIGPVMSLHICEAMLTTWRRKRGITNLGVVFKLSSKAALRIEISAVVDIFY